MEGNCRAHGAPARRAQGRPKQGHSGGTVPACNKRFHCLRSIYLSCCRSLWKAKAAVPPGFLGVVPNAQHIESKTVPEAPSLLATNTYFPLLAVYIFVDPRGRKRLPSRWRPTPEARPPHRRHRPCLQQHFPLFTVYIIFVDPCGRQRRLPSTQGFCASFRNPSPCRRHRPCLQQTLSLDLFTV